MYEEMRVKYLFVDLKYSTYVKLCTAITIAWLVVSGLLFAFARGSSVWLLSNGWWLAIGVALVGIFEALLAIDKAKKDFDGR